MSFLTTEISLPLWGILLIIVVTAILSRLIFRKKIITETSFFPNPFGGHKQSVPVAKQAEEETEGKLKRPNEIHILKLLAGVGDRGMLLKSIADQLELDSNTARRALDYLQNKKLVEVVSGMSGNQYYLTEVGKNFCRTKGITKAA